MSEVQIWHNPRCSKSREAMKLLEENGVDAEVVKYLEVEPDEEAIKALLKKLGIHAKELMRTNDPTAIAFAKALLEGEDIDCFEMDVHMSVLEGSIGVLPRRLMVRDTDHFRASAVLRDNDIPVEG